MLVRNWMQKDPVTISGDMTAREARDLFDELKVPFLPVVDDGRLRGLLARRDIRQAASFVTGTDDVHEMNFFNNRMKVKDLMVRKPVTLAIDDTVETALVRGAQFGRSFFPVLDHDRVVGSVSDQDIFRTLYQILGVDQKLFSITLEDGDLTEETVKEIVLTIFSFGASIYSLFTLVDPEDSKRRLLMRLKTEDPAAVQNALRDKGFHILETVDRSQSSDTVSEPA